MKTFFTYFFLIQVALVSAMRVSVNVNRYYADKKPFIEIDYRILGSSITSILDKNGHYDAKAIVKIEIKNKETQFIPIKEVIAINSQDLTTISDLIDQQRYVLNFGNYQVTLSAYDVADTTNTFLYSKEVLIEQYREHTISDIILGKKIENKEMGPFVKSGLFIEPIPYNLVNESNQKLYLYAEFYHSKEVLIAYGIYTGIEPSDSSKEVMVKYKKLSTAQVTPVFDVFDLNKLVSGNYHVKYAIIEKSKKEICTQFRPFINRNYPADMAQSRNFNLEIENSFVMSLDSSTLVYSLMALVPLITNTQAMVLQDVIKSGSKVQQQYFLYKYYKENYGTAMQQNYEAYMKVVRAVDKQFYSTVGYGFQTDRGHIFLKYGKPSKIISVEDEANTPPYEIWYFNFMEKTRQTNVRFIFFSPLLTNEFDLLHSTCYGEKNNPKWEIDLYKNAVGERKGTNDYLDATEMEPNFNRKARMLFDGQ